MFSKPTRIALSIWNDRLSPVLDVAGRLLVVSVRDGREQYRFEADIIDLNVGYLRRLLKHLKVDTLICGAVSGEYLKALTDSGLRVIPDLSGEVDAVVSAYLAGALMQPRFYLPGRTAGCDRQPARNAGMRRTTDHTGGGQEPPHEKPR